MRWLRSVRSLSDESSCGKKAPYKKPSSELAQCCGEGATLLPSQDGASSYICFSFFSLCIHLSVSAPNCGSDVLTVMALRWWEYTFFLGSATTHLIQKKGHKAGCVWFNEVLGLAVWFVQNILCSVTVISFYKIPFHAWNFDQSWLSAI